MKNLFNYLKILFKSSYKYMIVLSILIALFYVELPFVIYAPGGIVPLEKRIVVDANNKIEGSINMSYVSLVKGTVPMLLTSVFLPNWDVLAKNDVTLDNGSIEDLLKMERIYMASSIENATIVAYKSANKEIKITKNKNNITYISKNADTNLQIYDELISVDGNLINSLDDLKDIIKDKNEGDFIDIVVNRNEKEVKCFAKVYKDNDNTLRVGIAFLATHEYEANPKIEIKTKASESGSSGGLMLALGIYNAITEEDITRGRKIVGTGTIDSLGNVGEIDGIKYKILGAYKNKADIYLCPVANYEEALKVKDEFNLDLKIYSVKTFDEALEILSK